MRLLREKDLRDQLVAGRDARAAYDQGDVVEGVCLVVDREAAIATVSDLAGRAFDFDLFAVAETVQDVAERTARLVVVWVVRLDCKIEGPVFFLLEHWTDRSVWADHKPVREMKTYLDMLSCL